MRCLVTAWLLASIIGDNDDLGWRAVLPAVMLLVAFAAAVIARWCPGAWRIYRGAAARRP
jgi:hypothetical protein